MKRIVLMMIMASAVSFITGLHADELRRSTDGKENNLQQVKTNEIAPDDKFKVSHVAGWWSFEGGSAKKVADKSGNGHDGTVVGANWTPEGLQFQGGSARVDIADHKDFEISDNLMIEVELKFDVQPSAMHNMIVFRGDVRPGYDSYYLNANGGKVTFYVNTETKKAYEISAPYKLNEFVKIKAFYSSSRGLMKLFMNGDCVASKKVHGEIFQKLDPKSKPGIGIGNHCFGGYIMGFAGIIKELKISRTTKNGIPFKDDDAKPKDNSNNTPAEKNN